MIARPMCPSASHGQRVAAVLDVGLRDLELRRSEEDGAAHADHDPAQTRPEPSRVELWSVRANASPPFEFGQKGIFVPSGTRTPPRPR